MGKKSCRTEKKKDQALIFMMERKKTAQIRSEKADLVQSTYPPTLLPSGKCHIRHGQRSSHLSPLWFSGSSIWNMVKEGDLSLGVQGSASGGSYVPSAGEKVCPPKEQLLGMDGQCLGAHTLPFWTPFFAQAVGTVCECRDLAVLDGWKAVTILPWQSWAISLSWPLGPWSSSVLSSSQTTLLGSRINSLAFFTENCTRTTIFLVPLSSKCLWGFYLF